VETSSFSLSHLIAKSGANPRPILRASSEVTRKLLFSVRGEEEKLLFSSVPERREEERKALVSSNGRRGEERKEENKHR